MSINLRKDQDCQDAFNASRINRFNVHRHDVVCEPDIFRAGYAAGMAREQTENLFTTDACESLRARLAKYEDAEGRPVVEYSIGTFDRMHATIADQAREIERLNRMVQAADFNADCDSDTVRAAEAALKAQTSGVVLPERKPANFHWNECIEEVKRLNSPPISAGGVDERAAINPAYETCNGKRCGWCSEGAKPCLFTQQERDARDARRNDRAALTASEPNHGEQVREGFDAEHARALLEDAMGLVVDQATFEQCRDGGSHVSKIALLLNELDAMLAASPSAASQEQGE